MNKFNRLERDLRLFDLFFVPSSFIRTKLEIEKEIKRKISNLWYIPTITLEIGRLYFYYKILENYPK